MQALMSGSGRYNREVKFKAYTASFRSCIDYEWVFSHLPFEWNTKLKTQQQGQREEATSVKTNQAA